MTVLLAAAVAAGAWGQNTPADSAAMRLTGAMSPEELDESIVERFERLMSSPVRINFVTDSRLVSTGIFTRYQAAALRDYRSTYGDVLSVEELALVDGFGEEFARSVAPLVSFASSSLPGQPDARGGIETESSTRLTLRRSGGAADWGYMAKARTGNPDRWEVFLTAKSTPDAGKWPPEAVGGSAAYYGRAHIGKIIIGDFNARFGQGLLLWSGFSLAGAPSAGAFARHPGGISPAWSAAPTLRGAAAELVSGRFSLSTFATIDKLFGANLTCFARHGQAGITAISEARLSADARWNFRKLDVFGECAADIRDRTAAAFGGVTYNPAYGSHISLAIRYYPAIFNDSYAGAFRSSTRTSDERGVAIGFDRDGLSFTADWAQHHSKGSSQHKAVLQYSRDFTTCLTASVKLTSRFRPMDNHPWRNELRADLTLHPSGRLALTSRADVCHCQQTSLLAYAEAGYVNDGLTAKISSYVRLTAFRADKWDDRIYCYERGVPGAFSSPAYYGRGFSLSSVSRLKFRRWEFSFQASVVEYPWMKENKPGKAELVSLLKFTF